MTEGTLSFDDSAAYERFMGRWSRAVAPLFLNWLAPPRRASWLDVGCGTGILTEMLLQFCTPHSVHGIDPAPAQVKAAARGPAGERATFHVADARKLPFASASFDVVASALVLNFIPDRGRAMAEMRRVARPGGMVAGYVWDFGEERSPSGPLRRAMRRYGAVVPAIPGTDASGVSALAKLFEDAGLHSVETTTFQVCLGYADFDDFWRAQTPGFAPTTKIIAAMTERERAQLMRAVQAAIPSGPNGSIEYFAQADAVKARVPR